MPLLEMKTNQNQFEHSSLYATTNQNNLTHIAIYFDAQVRGSLVTLPLARLSAPLESRLVNLLLETPSEVSKNTISSNNLHPYTGHNHPGRQFLWRGLRSFTSLHMHPISKDCLRYLSCTCAFSLTSFRLQ